MASAVSVFKDNMVKARELEDEEQQEERNRRSKQVEDALRLFRRLFRKGLIASVIQVN